MPMEHPLSKPIEADTPDRKGFLIMKRRAPLFALWLLVFLLPACAAAARPLLFLSPDGTRTAEAICWYETEKGGAYFFLPANLDVSAMRFGLSGCETVVFRGTGLSVSAGDSAAFLAPGEYSLEVNGKTRKLTVMRGSPGYPALYITTESGSLTYIEKKKDRKEAGTLVFVGPEGETQYAGALEHIKCRGNSSMTFPKKNYQIKLETGTDLMGMGKAKKWILTSGYRDKSLLRNPVVYDAADYIGLSYTPEHCMAELYINNEYRGLYLFSEKVEIGDSRIAVADLEKKTEKLNDSELSSYPLAGSRSFAKGSYKAYAIPAEPEDLSGGYLVEFESYSSRYAAEPSAYATRRGNTLVVRSPEYASTAQMEYVSSRLQAFENAIFSADGTDPESGLRYDEIVDFRSLVLKYLLEEFCKNYDGGFSSQFFYKPEDEVSDRFFAGPAWDYDSSFGSYAREDNAKRVLTGSGLWIGGGNVNRLWWPALYSQADFRSGVRAAWKETMKPVILALLGRDSPAADAFPTLWEYADSIRASYEMNLVRWPRLPNPSGVVNTGHTLDMNITHLENFLTERLQFLSAEWER